MDIRPSIGVISPYWDFWETAVDIDVRSAKSELDQRCNKSIEAHGRIVWQVTADELGEHLPEVDLIIVVIQMAVPPERVTTFLLQRPKSINLVWAAHATPAIPEPFTHESIVVRGATVGASMLSASLNRAAVVHDVVLGEPSSNSLVQRLEVAAAAGKIRGATFSVIGDELEGYDFVTAPQAELDRLGINVRRHSPEEFALRVRNVDPTALDSYLETLEAAWHESTTAEGGKQAARYALALRGLMEDDQSAAGAMNCHVLPLRNDPQGTGIAPCFGLGCETSEGRPWTCTGDINTSLAMLFVSALGSPTFYHEMEAVDATTGEVIFANSGEHDSRFARQQPLRYSPNPWYPGPHPTPIANFQIAAGPATVVAISTINERLRAIVAEGEFTSRSAQSTGTMSAVFRFANSTGTEGWESWARAGAGHHSCATDTHLSQSLEQLCKLLSIEFVQVNS